METKGGENSRDPKLLQVDLRLKKAFKGRNERTSSRSSSGSWLQIPGSMSDGVAGDWAEVVVVMMGLAGEY